MNESTLIYLGGLVQVAALLYFVICMLCFLIGGVQMVNGGSDRLYNFSVKMFKAVGFLRLCKAVASQESRIERGLEVATTIASKALMGLLYALFIGLILLEVVFVFNGLAHLSLTNFLLIFLIIVVSSKY